MNQTKNQQIENLKREFEKLFNFLINNYPEVYDEYISKLKPVDKNAR